MPSHKWNQIKHKGTPEGLAKARRNLKRSIWKYRIQTLPRQMYESAKLWWTHGKLGLLLAGVFVLGVVLFVRFG